MSPPSETSTSLTQLDCSIISQMLLIFAPWDRMLEREDFWYGLYTFFNTQSCTSKETTNQDILQRIQRLADEYGDQFHTVPSCQMREPLANSDHNVMVHYLEKFIDLRRDYGHLSAVQNILERMKHRLVIEHDSG